MQPEPGSTTQGQQQQMHTFPGHYRRLQEVEQVGGLLA